MTRLERRMKEALEGNEREALEKYSTEIAKEKQRRSCSKNGFIRQCCDQNIETLMREKRQIEAATID